MHFVHIIVNNNFVVDGHSHKGNIMKSVLGHFHQARLINLNATKIAANITLFKFLKIFL